MAKAARVHGDTEGRAAAWENSVLGNISPTRLDDHWASNHWIRKHYEKKHSLVQTYVTIAISDPYVVDAAKRARLCGAGASRSEGFDSVSSVLALFCACEDQHARVPAMATLGEVYQGIFDGSKYTCRQSGAATIELDAFDAPVMCALIRLFLMKDTSDVQRAAAETIGVSAMYAQIGQLKGTDAERVDYTERCAIMAKRDVQVRQTQKAWFAGLHPTARSKNIVILSMKAQANALDMAAKPQRLLVVGLIDVCQRDITSCKAWSRFESPWGRLFAVALCAHTGACPGPDTCAIFASKPCWGDVRASFRGESVSSSSLYGGSCFVSPSSGALELAAAGADHGSMFGTMGLTPEVVAAILALDPTRIGGDGGILRDIQRGREYCTVFRPSV